MSPEASKEVKRITLVGNDTIQVELYKTDNLPDDLAKKVKNLRFSVQRLHVGDDKELIARLNELSLRKEKPVIVEQQEDSFAFPRMLLSLLLPALIVLGIIVFFLLPRFRDPLGGGFLSNYIKSPAKRYERSKMRVTFDDVAGMEERQERPAGSRRVPARARRSSSAWAPWCPRACC